MNSNTLPAARGIPRQQQDFISLLPASSRRFIRNVFTAAAARQLSPEGIVRDVRCMTQANLCAPDLYTNLAVWKRLRDALDREPQAAYEYATQLLHGGNR